jgi:hypothetical protein
VVKARLTAEPVAGSASADELEQEDEPEVSK